MEGKVLYAGIRFLGEKHRRGEVGGSVALRIGDQRKLVQLAVDVGDGLLGRLRAWRRTLTGQGREIVPFFAEVVRADADDLGEACAGTIDVGEHRQLRAADVVE